MCQLVGSAIGFLTLKGHEQQTPPLTISLNLCTDTTLHDLKGLLTLIKPLNNIKTFQ